MSDSIEYRTLIRCRDKLVTAFKLDAVSIADVFVSRSLISPAIASEVNELTSSEQKARRLVDCVFGQVQISHTQYDSFISVFSQFDRLKDLLRILNSTHRDLSSALQAPMSGEKSGQPLNQVDIEMIRSNEEEISAKFSALLLSVQKALTSQDVVVSDVRQFLANFFRRDECFISVTTFDKIFTTTTVNQLWDYQHYSPLERLTKQFLPNDQTIATSMTEYKANLTGFFLVTKIVDYIKYKGLEADDATEQPLTMKKLTPKQYRQIKVVLQLDRKVSELSLHYVHDLWCSFADEYELPCLTAVIDKIVSGSLEVSWLVLSHLIDRITPRSKFFRRHGIILVFIDDVILYDEKKMPAYEQKLLILCSQGTADISQFSDILNRGVDPDIHNEIGRHPLWYAVYHKRADLVQLLIENKADVDLATINDDFAETALIRAFRDGLEGIARILVEYGANIHYMGKKGQSPLWKASYFGHSTIVLLLLQHNGQVDLPTNNERGETALFAASTKGHLQTATLLLQHGAVVNYQNKRGNTPLYFACKNGHNELVDLLLADLAEVNKGQQSPLYTASLHGRVQIVRRLIQRGADVNLPTVDVGFSSSSLGVASQHNQLEVVKALIDNGAMVNYRNKAGWTALLVGANRGHQEVVNYLLHSKANTEVKNEEGRTALLVACWRGFLPIVDMLLKSGANTDAQDQEGLSGLMLATKKEHLAIVETLLDAKADPNIIDQTTGWTALFFAAKEGNIKIARLLIAKGVQVHLEDKNGVTAFDIAELNGHHQVSDELKQHTTQETKTEITESPATPKEYDTSIQEEFDFVERPSEDFFCPVTFELLLQPYLTTCCGHHLSQTAVTKLKSEDKPCPICKEPQLATVLDKFHQRKVLAVHVRCPNTPSGCEWVGEVGGLDQHIQTCLKHP